MRPKLSLIVFAAFLVFAAKGALADQTASVAENQPGAAAVEQTTPPPIHREMHMNVPPQAELLSKKIFLTFKDSAKGTELVRAKLAARGFSIVQEESAAEVKISLSGIFHVIGAGKDPINGKLGALLEASLEPGAGESPDYTHQNINLVQIAASSIPLGGISVPQLFLWMSQKTGIAGRFNEAITGDPRGWCLAESCNIRRSGAIFAVSASDVSTSHKSHWWVSSEVKDKKMFLDLAVMDAIDSGLQPLYELKEKESSAVSKSGKDLEQ